MGPSTWHAQIAPHRPALVRVLRRWSDELKRAALDPEDVAQVALLRAWTYRDTFTPGEASAWGWLVCIAHREASKYVRREGKQAKTATVRAADHGPVPFGFRNVDGVLVADAEEQAMLDAARRMIAEGASLRAVVRAGVIRRDGRALPRSTVQAALRRSA